MSWTNEDLSAALGRYEQDCIDAGMRRNAIHSYWDYARRFLAWRVGEYQPRGGAGSTRSTSLGQATVESLKDDAKAYAREVEAAGRSESTTDTYYRHAMFFVRWLEGEFVPGQRLNRR